MKKIIAAVLALGIGAVASTLNAQVQIQHGHEFGDFSVMDPVIRQANLFGLGSFDSFFTGSQVEAEISTEAIFDPANGLLTIDGFADLRVFADSPGMPSAFGSGFVEARFLEAGTLELISTSGNLLDSGTLGFNEMGDDVSFNAVGDSIDVTNTGVLFALLWRWCC